MHPGSNQPFNIKTSTLPQTAPYGPPHGGVPYSTPPWDLTLIAVSLPLFKTSCKILFQEHQLPNCVLLNLSHDLKFPFGTSGFEKRQKSQGAWSGLYRGWKDLGDMMFWKRKPVCQEVPSYFETSTTGPNLTWHKTIQHLTIDCIALWESDFTHVQQDHIRVAAELQQKIRDQFLLCQSLTVTLQILPRQTTWKVKTKVQKQDFNKWNCALFEESTL